MRERELRTEVMELTESLRADRALEGLRRGLLARGISPADTLLAGFMESEDHREWGVVVTVDRQVFEYERTTADREESGIIRWTEHSVPLPPSLTRDFPGLTYALKAEASARGFAETTRRSTTKAKPAVKKSKTATKAKAKAKPAMKKPKQKRPATKTKPARGP